MIRVISLDPTVRVALAKTTFSQDIHSTYLIDISDRPQKGRQGVANLDTLDASTVVSDGAPTATARCGAFPFLIQNTLHPYGVNVLLD